MLGYPPFTRDQRIGTALTLAGVLLVFGANYYASAQPWAWLERAGGLLLCAVGAYFNTRRATN